MFSHKNVYITSSLISGCKVSFKSYRSLVLANDYSQKKRNVGSPLYDFDQKSDWLRSLPCLPSMIDSTLIWF